MQIVKELIKEAIQNPLKRNTHNGEDGETSEKKSDNKRYRVSDIFELPATRLIANSTSCDEYIVQPKKIGYDNYPYVGYFSPKGNINLTKYNDTVGLHFVFLHINIKNSTAPDDYTQEFRMTLYDAGKFFHKDFNISGYSRRIRKTLIPTFWTYFGTPIQYYNTVHYIKTIMQTIPVNPSSTDYATIHISPQSFIIAEEQEQSTIGTIAAVHSATVFIYVFLFGVDSMKPWGFAHSRCCGFKRKAKEGLLPIVEPRAQKSSEKLLGRIEELESFRIILEKYVVNTSLLETIKEEQRKRQERQQEEYRFKLNILVK
ncbi:5565_t:CDS:2 [Entrophospora sp. SA101]|nr:5565_t:CDS:2 [Entrophospora sp. SA101]